jgi:hypothetical protein
MEPESQPESVKQEEIQDIAHMPRSRLSRHAARNTKKDILLTLFGIIVVFFLLGKFGLPILINATLFVSGSKDTAEPQTVKQTKFVPPPTLLSTFDATNSAQIAVKGSGSEGQTIELFVNNKSVDKTTVDKDKKFSFIGVKLTKGDNNIHAKAIDKDDKEAKSDFSNTVTIRYKSGNPNLTVDSPSDNQSFNKDNNKVEVKGKTDVGNKVYVNDLWAIVDDSGNFSYTLPLKSGDTDITIVSTDDAGNKTEVKRKVSYNP